ncbi:MAG: four helix bundle protein [Chitinophagaceae bacterium]|nr:MAG: four helix bundle protein [Chitinophagaceae bacterium]
MFLNLKHKTLRVYVAVRELTQEVYKISELLPVSERFNMVQQIRRAALSVKLNLAEGSTRRSEVERKRYIEIARGSVVELDAALETAIDLNYFKTEQLTKIGELLNKCFAMLTKMLS